MLKSKFNLFTLIELIVVIVILGILAAIIIPNVSEQKKDAITSMMNGNIRNIQTAVDTYALHNSGNYPVAIQPTLQKPQIIDINELYPKYIKSKPDTSKTEDQHYWVDVFGKVWGSTVSSPSNMFHSNEFIEWSHVKNAEFYNIYAINEDTKTGKVQKTNYRLLRDIPIEKQIDKIKVENSEGELLISSTDQYGLESAPRGLSSEPISDWFTPIVNKEGSFEFSLISDELMYWISYTAKTEQPEGTSIKYEFSYLQENGEYSAFTEDFFSLKPAKELKVKITTIGANGKYPSILDFHVFFHYKDEDIIDTTRLIRENIDDKGYIINPELPVRVVDSFIATDKVKEIIIRDQYVEEPTGVHYTYQPPAQSNYIPVTSLVDIPQGSTIRIEREYKSGEYVVIEEPLIIKKSNLEFYHPQPVVPIEKKEWETMQTLSFFAHSGDYQRTKWLSAEIKDKKPENTRIVYSYSYSNTTGGFSKDYPNIQDLPSSRSVRVKAELQVKTEFVSTGIMPEVESIRLHHERGYVDLDLVKPTVEIIPVKSNNLHSDSISDATSIEWTYQAADPRGKEIVDVEWGGDIREKYPIGTYSVSARVKNSSGYWSDITYYRFTVISEKPIAKITMTPEAGITTGSTVYWGHENSNDPDGDGIKQAEWENKLTRYNAGQQTVRLRVQDNEGNWSDWVEKTFSVTFMPILKEVSFGSYHGIGLTDDKKVAVWGSNNHGQLGTGQVVSGTYFTATLVPGLENVKKAEATPIANIVLLENGEVYSWGAGNNGVLGLGSTNNVYIPTKVEGLPKIVDIFTGYYRVFAIAENGDVYGWGWGSGWAFSSTTATNVLSPIKLDSLSNIGVVKISTGSQHHMALLQDGKFLIWGYPHDGQLGMKSSSVHIKTPTLHPDFTDVKDVLAYTDSSMILLNNGDVYVWGDNDGYKLGIPSPYQPNYPIKHPELTNVKEIAGGTYAGYAVLNDGRGATFGNYDNGLYSGGTRGVNFFPELQGIIHVTAKDRSVMFFKQDGTLIGISAMPANVRLGKNSPDTRVPSVISTSHTWTE